MWVCPDFIGTGSRFHRDRFPIHRDRLCWLKQLKSYIHFPIHRDKFPPLALICNQCRYNKQNTKSWRAEDYVYCSAIGYAGGKGMLDIFVIE